MRSLSRPFALAALAAIVLAIGCDEMPAPSPSATSAPSASASAAAGPANVEVVAKAYLDAARKHAETCLCLSDPFEGLIRDWCKIKVPEFDAVMAARAGVDAALGGEAPPDPAAGAFLREAQLHATWLSEYRAYLESTSAKIDASTRSLRGGVYAYQRLAQMWNAWHPKEPVSGIAYEAYHPGGVSSSEYPLWVAIRNEQWLAEDPESKANGGKGRPRYLPWIECIDGPCLVGY